MISPNFAGSKGTGRGRCCCWGSARLCSSCDDCIEPGIVGSNLLEKIAASLNAVSYAGQDIAITQEYQSAHSFTRSRRCKPTANGASCFHAHQPLSLRSFASAHGILEARRGWRLARHLTCCLLADYRTSPFRTLARLLSSPSHHLFFPRRPCFSPFHPPHSLTFSSDHFASSIADRLFFTS